MEGEEKQRDELKGELESIHLYWITHCGKFGEHKRVLQTSQVHPQLDIRRAKRMNQFSYNIATTTWALEHVLFVIDYKVLTIHRERKQRILLPAQNTPQSVKRRKRFITLLKLSMENSLLRINCNENAGKESQSSQVLVNILAWQKPKARSSVWIVQNDVHIAKL